MGEAALTDADLNRLSDTICVSEEREKAGYAGVVEMTTAMARVLLARAEAFARIRRVLATGGNLLQIASIIDETEAKERG